MECVQVDCEIRGVDPREDAQGILQVTNTTEDHKLEHHPHAVACGSVAQCRETAYHCALVVCGVVVETGGRDGKSASPESAGKLKCWRDRGNIHVRRDANDLDVEDLYLRCRQAILDRVLERPISHDVHVGFRARKQAKADTVISGLMRRVDLIERRAWEHGQRRERQASH
jgi:hypothetical protein